MQITFRERWLDRRLAYEYMHVANMSNFLTVPHVKNNIWMPDSFFPVRKKLSYFPGKFYFSEKVFLSKEKLGNNVCEFTEKKTCENTFDVLS